MPGILIIHGFHQPKTQGELQDMGVNWARLGCTVLVPDQLCHGERRQHPFVDAKSYAGKFNLPRQDYYSRANTGIQLDLIGDSLMGWMVHDAMTCVSVLLAHPGVDKERIIVLGAVAAGGDTAAVTAALDPRIAAVVPFNFGGPEPETTYPLPAGPEKAFPYASGGHWDSTRRLRDSARDPGFLAWEVLGSIAPRRLIYAHEFAWDREHDPVWKRLQKIYSWYDAADNLAFVHGSGTLFGKPEGTGCANIGAVHRKAIYPILQRWFRMTPPDKEVQQRRPAEDLICLTPEAMKEFKLERPDTIREMAVQLAKNKAAYRKSRFANESETRRRARVIAQWTKALDRAPDPLPEPKATAHGTEKLGTGTLERISLGVEPGIVVPLVLLLPAARKEGAPVVVGLAQEGKQEFLRREAAAIAALLADGVAVCLPDVRGTGETRPAGDRRGPPAGRLASVQETSAGTLLANEELMLGRTLLGARLRDLRSVLLYLRGRPELDKGRVALWGVSFAPTNPPGAKLEVPWDAEKLPHQAEPLGGLLALLGGLLERDAKREPVQAVAVRGSLMSYESILASQFCYIPHDALVPGVLDHVGDLSDVAATLAPRPLRLEGLVDGLNRPVASEELKRAYETARKTYGGDGSLVLNAAAEPGTATAKWLVTQLKK